MIFNGYNTNTIAEHGTVKYYNVCTFNIKQ